MSELVKECPRGYIPLTPKLPRACREFCPIARADLTETERAEPMEFYTPTSAARNPKSPLCGKYSYAEGSGRGYGGDLSINLATYARKVILSISKDASNPNARGRGARKIPHCALQAYRDFTNFLQSRKVAAKQDRAFRAERKKQIAELRAMGLRIRVGKKPERREYNPDVVRELQLLGMNPSNAILKAIKYEIQDEKIAEGNGRKYKRVPDAAIARKFGMSRQRAHQIKRGEGIK